ncbi:putative GTPase-activating protein gyp3 [Glarea lozoyensis 74030]|uniref:Putative GTPase-activating protein gyp3 n=1 Tax=Glarea lozoyensis (strain ATCC 74030 / MF5533) TaxID=1104152 RepID=H0EQG5_GLAL7|nr:putative GTPase-activating protein gyp3 [Glarea lozoyensis 74030]
MSRLHNLRLGTAHIMSILRDGGKTKSVKVKRFVRKGIPPDWRGAAWFFYAGGPAMLEKHPGVYADLLQKAHNGEVSETDNEIIERDLNRTFPDNIKFKPDPIPGEIAPDAETPILQSLRNVLQAFSIYNPKIGYCQSLNFLAGLLLLFMDEEKSFWMLNVITRVYLPGTHELNLEGANVDLGVLMIAIKDMMPGVWAKIGGELDGTAGNGRVSMRLPPITLCTTAWFMSCFIGTLPIESTLRVWDSFFYEGSKTLFRIALTIFKLGEAEIKAVTDPMEIFQVVQTIPRRLIDANVLLEACFKRRNGFGHLSQETIERGRAQRRQGYADERAKAAGEIATTNVIRKKTLLGRKERQ